MVKIEAIDKDMDARHKQKKARPLAEPGTEGFTLGGLKRSYPEEINGQDFRRGSQEKGPGS
jgi:hypothetical protein